MQIKNKKTGKVIYEHKSPSMKETVETAVRDHWPLSEADLFGIDLFRAHLHEAVLDNADLRNVELSGSDLIETDLSGADLRGARINNADLSSADLRNCNLSGTQIKFTYLYGVNLRGANLSGADLSGSDFSDAKMANTDLSGANLQNTRLTGADLSGANFVMDEPINITGKAEKFYIPNAPSFGTRELWELGCQYDKAAGQWFHYDPKKAQEAVKALQNRDQRFAAEFSKAESFAASMN